MGESTGAAVVAEITRIRESRTRFPVVQAVLSLRRLALRLDDEALAAMARGFDRNPADVRRVAAWIDGVLAGPTAAAPVLHRCVSVSCSANGAAALWSELGPLFESVGLALPVVGVHCLGQCEQGPSLGHGDQVYTGGAESVIRDDRPWREAPFGPEA